MPEIFRIISSPQHHVSFNNRRALRLRISLQYKSPVLNQGPGGNVAVEGGRISYKLELAYFLPNNLDRLRLIRSRFWSDNATKIHQFLRSAPTGIPFTSFFERLTRRLNLEPGKELNRASVILKLHPLRLSLVKFDPSALRAS